MGSGCCSVIVIVNLVLTGVSADAPCFACLTAAGRVQVSSNLYTFLQWFFKAYPEELQRKFYIVAERWAGRGC